MLSILILFLFLGKIFYDILIFTEVITLLCLSHFSVLERGNGTVGDTSHTMGTILTPYRLFINELNIIKGTKLFALSTSDAIVFNVKILCGKLEFAPDRVKGYGYRGAGRHDVLLSAL